MFKTNVKIALRNLWKYKGFSFVNVLGLAVGIAGCILITIYVLHETSYDQWNAKRNQVFKITVSGTGSKDDVSASLPAELAPMLKQQIPEIADYTNFFVFNMGKRLLSYKENSFYINNPQGVDSTFFNVFPYTFLAGNPANALDAANSLVISEDVARRLFGNESALGKEIKWQGGVGSFIITGVFKMPATPTHFYADVFRKITSHGDGWNNFNFYLYILAKPGVSAATLEQKINAALKTTPLGKDPDEAKVRVFAQPLTDVYLHANAKYDFAKRGNVHIIQILSAVALLLLLIATINFANFNITQSVRRAKETGLRKVLGAVRSSLVWYYLLEAAVQTMLAVFVGMALTELFLPMLNHQLGVALTFFTNPGFWNILCYVVLAALLIILLSGGYVAYYISGFEPVQVLKGNLMRSTRGAGLRKALLILQFALAAVAVGGLLIIHSQQQYMEKRDPGFNKDQVLLIPMHKVDTRVQYADIRQRLLKLQGVQLVSRVNYTPGDKDMQVIGRDFNGTAVSSLNTVTIDYGYADVVGLRMVEGRFFDAAHAADSNGIVVNETAAKRFELRKLLGKPWIGGHILLGIVKDFTQRSAEAAAEPLIFVMPGGEGNTPDKFILKVQSNDIPQTMERIRQAWQTIEPEFPLQYTWLDQQFGQLFLQYQQMDNIFMAFAGITLFIALLGIFVLAAYMAQQRTREIGVRKVLGASMTQLVQLLNKEFVLLVLIANCIALPVLWLLASRWLQGFAYRIALPWMAFVATLLITIVCTILTVSIQAWKAAKADPIKALKYE